MPRGNRYIESGHAYHLTARCHDRTSLFSFKLVRDEYRKRMRKLLRGSGVSMLNYCITSNHVHLLCVARDKDAVSDLMQKLQGEFAEWYNRRQRRSRRRGRTGSFWEGRYWSTMVENGRYLWNCMTYIDLNMVRAGEVCHPREWRHCGYDELTARRTKHLVLDKRKLLEVVGSTADDLARDYEAALCEALGRARLERVPYWTEAVAVGSEAFVRDIAGRMKRRVRIKIDSDADGSWTVREPDAHDGASLATDIAPSCGSDSGPKIARVDGMWVLYRG
jgi:putative transposase